MREVEEAEQPSANAAAAHVRPVVGSMAQPVGMRGGADRRDVYAAADKACNGDSEMHHLPRATLRFCVCS